MIFGPILAIAFTIIIPALATAGGLTDEQQDFIVNRLAFWLSLGVTLATATGIGLKVASHIRKKVQEDGQKRSKEITLKLDEHDKKIRGYVDEIVTEARSRRDRHELTLENMVKRMDTLEQQQSLQMQIIMQNQEAVRDLLLEAKRKGS